MADNVLTWVRFESSNLANFCPISSKLERSLAIVVALVVA